MKLIILSGLTFMSFSGFSQEVINSSGNYAETEQGMMNWSVGETVVFTGETTNTTLTQGFNQSEFVITALKDGLSDKTNIAIYPNPTSDKVNIRVGDNDLIESLVLTDINGVHLFSVNPGTATHSIDLSSFAVTTIFLTIKTTNKNHSTYQVLKLK